MSKYELRLPQMGESVAEATITAWAIEVGDVIEQDDTVVEIATDKVDSDVPCEVGGTLIEKLFDEGEVVKVGEVFAVFETDEVVEGLEKEDVSIDKLDISTTEKASTELENEVNQVIEQVSGISKIGSTIENTEGKFYSPLVKKIAETEGISQIELDTIVGTGLEARVTKQDILTYVENRGKVSVENKSVLSGGKNTTKEKSIKIPQKPKVVNLEVNSGDEMITLSRMGKLVSDHMIHSKHKAAHVQSFIEVDVTNIVAWRNKVKDKFLTTHSEKLTFTPIFMMAIAKAIKKYPLVNITYDGDEKVVLKKDINLGMASALPDGNLIVPVIKSSGYLNLLGMTKAVNDLAYRSKNNKLKPEDVKGGTYTVTNIGGFGSVFGTPIINQPECAILALGAIRKVPAVVETPQGDFIGIRQKMYISHSYDHRVINGALGGMFIKEVKDILEAWNVDQEI